MANSLKDLLNDALNISTGKSYKAEPARTVMRQASAPAQARTDNYVQNRPSQPARRRSLWSRAFDQVNPFDNNLTWKQETATQNKNLIQQAGQLGGQTARGITTVVPQAINSTAELGGDTVDLARAGVAQATGNWKARDAALNRGLQSKYSNPGQGLLGTGGLIDNQTASKPIPTSKLVKTIAGKGVQGAAEIGSAVTGGFAGKELVNQGFKQGFQSQVPNLVKSSVLNAAQGGADTFNRGGNSRDVVKAAATSALLGTAADVGLGVAGAATSKLVRAGVDNLPTKPVFADFNGKVPNDPIVNPNTGETLSQSIKKLEGYGWAEKDIDAYKNRVLGVKDNSPEIQPYKLKNNTVYHGTAQENVQPILRDGFKAGSELPESAFRGGGYGQMQDSISFSTDAKQASVFGAVSPRGSVIQAELKPNAKVVTVKGIDYAEDLNPRINELKKKGIDAVYLDGEKEVVVLDKNSVRATGKYKDFKAIDAKNTDFSELQPKKKLLNQDGFARLPGKDDPLEALKAEARKYKSADEFVGKDNTQFADLPNYKFDVAQANKDFADIASLTEKITSGMPKDATKAQRVKVYKNTIEAVNKKYGTKLSTDINDILETTRVANKYPNELAYEAGRKAKTDLYNQATKGAKSANPLEALKAEARKYKSAEEFADSLNAMKYGKVTGVGQLPVSKINKAQIKALTERGLPHTDTNLKVSDFKPGRQVTQPLEVYSKGGSWVVENGNHRLAQALANGDETVPVVFKGGEGKKYSTPITDLYNQATAPQVGKTPKGEMSGSLMGNGADKKLTVIQTPNGRYTLAGTIPEELTVVKKNNLGQEYRDAPVFNTKAEAEAYMNTGKAKTANAPQKTGNSDFGTPTAKDVENSLNPLAVKERGGVARVEPSARGSEYWNVKFNDGSEAMNIKLQKSTTPPAQVGKTDPLSKFGWKSENTSQGTMLYNRNGKHVATITEKKGRYTAIHTDGTRIATGADPTKLADDVARKYFYATEVKPTQATEPVGGTLRPDKAPEPYTNPAIQSGLTAERARLVQENTNRTKAALDFDRQPTPKKAFHSTASLDIEGGKLRASQDGAMGEGVYLHTNPDTAKYAGAMQADGNMADQRALDVNLKTDNLFKWADQEYPTPDQVALIKKRGYDGIYKKDGEIVVFDPSKVDIANPPAQVGKTDPMQQVFDANPVNEQATRLQRQSIDQPVKDTSYLSRMTNEDAARPAEFNAVAATAGSKSAKKLEQELVSNAKVTEKLKEAQLSGEEVNFYAKKDKNGRSVGIEEFDPTKHRIESGFVIDNNGKVLGNHVKVDSTGVQVNVGGDLVNMDAVVGNPTDWQGSYRMMETMDRNIKRNAPDEATYRRTREFLIDHKIKNEANFKEELRSQRQNLGQQAKDVQSVRPSNVSKDEFNSDIFDFIEGKTGSGDIKAKYGNGAQAIIDYKNSTRQLYDNLLDRVNEVFAKYGEAPVSKRKDYITHINELMNKPSFAGELFGQLQNTMLGEGMQTTRKSVPGSIAGRTETFEPRKRWNRFFQARKGGEFTKDPFKAVDAYLEPTLYNIHMTESAVRARAVETAFRTADEIRNMDKQRFTQALTEDFEKYRNGDNSKLITGFQEYANALAGKTQRFDRQIIDASKGTEMGLRVWQGLQRVGGRGTVLGNAQSVLSQTLNQPLTLADAGVKNYLKGVASSLTGNTPIDKSPFIRARATKVDSPFKGVGQKALDVGGVPLEQVELAMVKTTWNAEYHKAVEKGFKGQKAIMEADRATEQVVAGRGIADKPEAYRSTAANGFLQYTLEVAATNKKFWQDLSPTQKATYVAAVFGVNSVFGLVTGYEPLPDFLGATVDTAQDFADPNDKRSAAQKAVGGAQRYASAGVEMNPLATAVVNTFLNKDQRQAIFGQDSSLGRFEGTTAPVQVVRNTVDAASKLTKKQYGAAASSAIKNAPYGNQVNKTATSAAMLARGYATDAKGNPTYAAPTSPIGKVQSLLFGPNSTKNAQNYYNNNQRPITGKSDLAAIKDSGNKQSTVAELQKTKLENRTKGDTSYDELKNTLQNTFGGKFRDKSEQELRDLSKTGADAKTYYSQLQGLKNINNTPDLPDGIDAKARNVLTKRSRLAQEGKVKWGLKKADDKEITNTIHSWLPQTAEKPQITNDIAVKWAELEKKRASGTLGKLEEESQKKTILRDAYNSSLSEDEKDLYKLSKAKLSDALNNGLISEDNVKKALEVEKKLFDAGLIGKETLASKLGVSARGYKGKSSGKKGKSGKGRKGSTKGKYDYKLFAFNSKPSNTQKSLRELVKKATL